MGAATAALRGLLSVAVSIRAEPISRSAELRSRAAQTMTLLLTRLLVAALLAAGPALRAAARSGGLDAIDPTVVTCSLLVVAAVILILGHKDGIYPSFPR
jgi:hypothetical protein